jgi:MoaA/NifB/PqqE/SkfB family radical SAM enzyme
MASRKIIIRGKPMLNVATLQRYLPASVKNALKPYYRRMFPNQLCILLWVTFRCNYRCSYCPVVTRFDFSTIYGKEDERTPQDWIAALDRLPAANVYISGGEPFLFKGLPELVNGLGKHQCLGIVTNATVKTSVYEQITRKVHLNLSFHREFASEDEFLAKIDELRRVGRFHLNVNLVATRENVPLIPKLEKLMTDHRISLHIDPFVDPDLGFTYTPDEMAILVRYLENDRLTQMDRLDFNEYGPKECSAGRNYINIMPDGTVFRCAGGYDYYHSPLKRKLLQRGPNAPYDAGFFKMGNLFDPNFKLDSRPVFCDLPCTAACDRDMATIRGLEEA